MSCSSEKPMYGNDISRSLASCDGSAAVCSRSRVSPQRCDSRPLYSAALGASCRSNSASNVPTDGARPCRPCSLWNCSTTEPGSWFVSAVLIAFPPNAPTSNC